MPTPQHVFLPTILGVTAVGQSAWISIPFSVNGFEAAVGFQGHQPNTANISAGWECYLHRSPDNGVTYPTVPTIGSGSLYQRG
jgi:hypothetical protein